MKFRKKISKYLDDILLIIGSGLIFYGVYQIYKPAGYITSGICFIAYAFLFAKKGEW